MKQSERKRGTKAEWVATMALIAELDRDAYRELRAQAWDSVVPNVSSAKSN